MIYFCLIIYVYAKGFQSGFFFQFFAGAQTTALQEQSAIVKRFMDVKKMFDAGEINPGNYYYLIF